MKFLSKHILVSSFACLLFSWQVKIVCQPIDEIVESEPKKRGMQSDEDEMEVDDCPNKNEAESSGEHLKNCPLSYYSNDGHTFLSSERKLSDDFEKLRGSEHFQTIEKANVTDLLNLITSIHSLSQYRLDILHPNIDEFAKEPAELFEKMAYGSNVTTKGDLSISAFEKFYLKIRGLMATKWEECYTEYKLFSQMNLFSSLENQSKADKVLPTHKKRKFNFKSVEKFNELTINLVCGLNNLTVEDIEKDNTKYTSLYARIDFSSDLTVLSAALSKYQIVNLSINFNFYFDKFSKLHEIIKNGNYAHLTFFGFSEPSIALDNFLINLASTSSCWKYLKELKLLHFSYQAIFEAFKNELPVLENLLFWDCLLPPVEWKDLSKTSQVPSVQDIRIEFYDQELSKEGIEYLLDIFPNAKEALITTDGELTGFQVKSKNLVELQICAKSIKNEHEFMTNLTKPKFSFIANIRRSGGLIKWTKVEDRIFYETLFENLISPEISKKLIEEKKESEN